MVRFEVKLPYFVFRIDAVQPGCNIFPLLRGLRLYVCPSRGSYINFTLYFNAQFLMRFLNREINILVVKKIPPANKVIWFGMNLITEFIHLLQFRDPWHLVNNVMAQRGRQRIFVSGS